MNDGMEWMAAMGIGIRTYDGILAPPASHYFYSMLLCDEIETCEFR